RKRDPRSRPQQPGDFADGADRLRHFGGVGHDQHPAETESAHQPSGGVTLPGSRRPCPLRGKQSPWSRNKKSGGTGEGPAPPRKLLTCAGHLVSSVSPSDLVVPLLDPLADGLVDVLPVLEGPGEHRLDDTLGQVVGDRSEERRVGTEWRFWELPEP